jgi:hypothetical protein
MRSTDRYKLRTYAVILTNS